MPIDIPRVSISYLILACFTRRTVLEGPTHGSSQRSCGNQPTYGSIPSSGRESTHSSSRNPFGRKPTYRSNQQSRGNQSTSGSIPSSGSKPTHGSNRNPGSKPTMVATETPSQSTTLAITSGSAGNSSNEGPRAMTVSDSLIDNCDAETWIDHQVDYDDKRASPNSILSWLEQQ